MILGAVLIAVFVGELLIGAAGNETALVSMGALRTRGWSAGDWWRIGTFSFLHLNTVHLTLNLAALYWLGGLLERRAGAAVILVVFASGGVGSGVAGMLLGPYLPTTGVAVGASGAIYGLLAAATILAFGSARSDSPDDRRLRRVLAIAVAIAVLISLLPGVSLAGHLGGLVGGGIAMAVLVGRSSSRPEIFP